MSSPQHICITLKAFDKAVNIDVAGSVSSADTLPVHITDADATVNISLSAFKSLFAFYSDYVDVDNVVSSDKFHYIDGVVVPTSIANDQSPFYISNSLVTANPVTNVTPSGASLGDADMSVAKDYVRHLSRLLFNTEYGVDLFVNEEELVDSVKNALNAALLLCFNDMLEVSTKGADSALKGAADHKYLLDDYSGLNSTRRNICAELLNVLLRSRPERFTNMSSLEITDSAVRNQIDPAAAKLYRIPFIEDDCIEIKVALKPALSQDWFGEPSMMVNGASVDKVDNQRSYKIDLVLKA
jgi:hypothetical protein